MQLYQWLLPLGHMTVGLLFVLIDLLIALCLANAAVLHHHNDQEIQKAELKKDKYGKGVEPLLIDQNELLPLLVAGIYLLNPYSILCCAGYSTQCFSHLSIVFIIWMSLRGNWVLCGMGLSLCSHLSLYPIMLILPLTVMACNNNKKGGIFSVLYLMLSTVLWSIFIVVLCYYITGSWEFINAVYGVIITVPDFTPNVGLFWYFFTDMFDHFRLFFICVFQINAFIHSVPLTIRFSHSPMFLIYTILSMITIFKSYPTIGDFTLPLSLLPLWSYTFRYLRFSLVVLGCILVSSIAGPILWFLWIHTGSANANFFFGMTITYNIAQIFLLLDVVNSYLTYQYDLKHGLPRLDKQGKPVLLRLQ